MAEAIHIPGAWFDLRARLGAIKAIASAISQILPFADIPAHMLCEIEDAGYLTIAAQDLLELAWRDAERLELELKTGVPQ